MVLWVFAGTVAFAGSAAAATNVSTTVDDVNPDSAGDQATYTTTITIDDTDGDTIESVRLDFTDTSGDTDLSNVDQNDVSVSDQDGNSIDVQNLNTADNGGDGAVDTLAADIDTTETTDVSSLTIVVDDVGNAQEGNHTLVGELSNADDSSDGTGVFASDSDVYTIGSATNSVTFVDQDSLGDSVFVDQATTNETDAFLAVWNTTDTGAPDTVLGVVPFDGSSTLENQTVALDPAIEEDQELIAAVHPNDGGNPDTSTIYASDTAQVTVVEPDRAVDTANDVPTLWQGQITLVTGDFTAGNDYQIREVDGSQDDREVGDLVREVRALQDGQLIVRTSRIGSGLYVLEEDNKRLASGDSLASNLSDDENFGFEIAVQDLNVELEDDSVVEGNNISATFDSNRAGYNMTVTATDEDGDETELTTFSDLGDFEEDVQIPFDVDPGNYTVNFTVDDTTAEDSAEVEVREEPEIDAEFTAEANTYSVPRGDVAEIEISGQPGEEVTLVFGDEEKNNYEVDIVAVPNDDGNLTITANTFAAGDNRTTDETPGLIFTAEEGEIVDINRTSGVDVPGVLDRGDYDLTLQEAPGDAEEFDIGVLRITRSGYESLNQYRGPSGQFSDLDSESAVRTGLSENGTLTESSIVTMTHRDRSSATVRTDVLVHEAQISGIYGALDLIQKSTEDELSDRELLQVAQNATGDQGAILSVEFVQTNFAQNRNPKAATFAPDGEAYRFIIDEDNQSLYLVTNVRDLDISRTETVGDDTRTETGERYNVTVEVGEGLEDQFSANGIDFDSPEGEDTVNLTIEDREAEFDTTGGEIQVDPDSGQEIAGTTNIAPGTEMSVQVQATSGQRVADEPEPEDETPIFQRVTVTVGPNGTFASEEFDFSNNEVGRTFFVLATRQGFENDAETEGVIVEGEQAAVSMSDVTATEGESVDTVTVDAVFLPNGGFVTIHDGTLLDGATFDSVRGTSDYLSEGEHSNVEVALDDPYTEDGTAIPMPHQDTNDNQEYDFVTSEGAEDGPYTDDAGEAIVDTAEITFEPEETPTPTDTPDDSTPTDTPDDSTPTDTDTPEPEDQAGFGAVIALIALLGAALLAARRNAF
jgi:PGF-CTERM protein